MKKLINDPDHVVRDQLLGLAKAHRDLVAVHWQPAYVMRADAPVRGKVAVVSGGGSGHEPLHAGFVGKGMLDAACPGEVFTSPTPEQIYQAGKAVASDAGVLCIVKNYTGDIMNFQLAADLLRGDGIAVQNAVIDDDVAVKDSLYTAGRRGLGTTIFAEKICGAAAEAGYTLEQVTDLCRQVNCCGKSMGMALTPCVTPATGQPSFELGGEEMEIGIGIHGEPGIERARIKSADEVTEILAEHILEDGAYERTLPQWDEARKDWIDVTVKDVRFAAGDQVIVLVNGMGGTPLSELYIVYSRLADILAQRKIEIVDKLIGSYITSLEMQGCSITLLRANDLMGRFWRAPVHTPALRWGA